MQHSQQINEIATALAKAQGEMKNPQAEAVNAFQKYSYAKAQDFLNTIRGPLTKNGISFTTDVETQGGERVMALMLSHASGQWLKYTMPLRADLEPGKGMSSDQIWGSHLTYRKKSLLSLVFGIHGDEDNDGTEPEATKAPAATQPKKFIANNYEKVSSDQVKQIMYEIGEHTDIGRKLLETYSINELAELPKDHYITIINKIKTTVNSRSGK
jgi:hypothetical protein